jgi:hypothetical protein
MATAAANSAQRRIERTDNLRACMVLLYRDRPAFQEMLGKPATADPASRNGQRVFVVTAQSGVEPRRSIAKAFADVTPPPRSSASNVRATNLALAPFRARAEFAGDASGKFSRQNIFPVPAGLVRKADPDEMENLMDQDSFKLARLGEESAIEQNDTSWNVRGRQMGSQSAAELHSDGTAGKSRQHSE